MRRAIALVLLALFAPVALAGVPYGHPSRFVAGYHMPGKYLVLSADVRAEDGTLKPFDQLTRRQIADIYHEMWHAYFIECEMPTKDNPKGGELYRTFKAMIDERYAEYPADKRMEIHEEAVADYLDALTETFVQMKRHLSPKTPERRHQILTTERAYVRCWEDLFADFYRGYYTVRLRAGEAPVVSPDDATTTATGKTTLKTVPGSVDIVPAAPSLKPFIDGARAYGMPVHFLVKAVPKLNGVAFIDFNGQLPAVAADLVWSKWTLPEEHRELLERTLLEGKFPRRALEAFSEAQFTSDIDKADKR